MLILIAVVGNRFVSQTSDLHIERIASRAAAQQRVGKLQMELQKIEQWLGLQIIEPGSRPKSELLQMLDVLEHDYRQLDKDLLVANDEQPLMSGESSAAILPNFRVEASTFLHVSRNNMLRFPSTYIMQAYMQPRSRSISEVLDSLIYDMPVSSNQVFMQRIYETRHVWQQLLSEFRLVVANRFSVFADNPNEGMQSRTYNIEIYLEQMRAQLLMLEEAPIPESLQPLPDDVWKNLQMNVQKWKQHYRDLMTSLVSDKWRVDLYQFKSVLQPQIRKMEVGLNQLQANLTDQAARDITGLTRVASRLSWAILVTSLLGVLLIIGAYFYLNIRVLRPMSVTAKALRQEAKGENDVVIPTPKLQETRDLVEAFDEMRSQVLKRERGLDYLAHHDPLTQLPNRLLFKDRLEHALEMAKRHDQVLACLFLDLDNFKQINDTLGHLAGDELLTQVARRLQDTLRSSDTIARLGGDEFAILLEDIGEKVFAEITARKILDSLSEIITIDDHQFHVTVSVGIALYPYDDNSSEALLRDADAAMYEAKRQGKNSFCFFSRELVHQATQQLKLEQRLRQAVKKKELLYYYQPIIGANNNRLIAAEALLRWAPPGERIKGPAEFIGVLQNLDIDLRRQLTVDLAAQVSRLQRRVLKMHRIPLRVTLNLAPSMLRDPSRHEELLTVIKNMDYPSQIAIEITEDTLIEDLANAHVLLSQLRNKGIPLMLDDFGTGQSSLNHLRSFPFDSIKIDREFVRNLTTNKDDEALVNAVVKLAHSFSMRVVAEGVETQAQKQMLLEMGCDCLQGYLISKPLSQDDLLVFLDAYRESAVKSA